MNKHQTLVYLKYGKIISKINDKIKNTAIKSDMIKFLVKFPGNLIYPNMIYQVYSENQGRFDFEITKSSKIIFIYIDFDGNNNFQLYIANYIKSDIKWCTEPKWISIDNIEYFVDTHLDDFKNIIE